jgi:hypothetical protein
LRYGDELVRFGGREINSANAFKNVLGTYPTGWRVPMTFRRDGREFERRVRLASVHREGELEAMLEGEQEPPVPDRPKDGEDRKPDKPEIPGFPKKDPQPRMPRDGERPGRAPSRLPRAVRKYYEASPGYANYWFNRYHQQRVWNAYLALGDFAESGWNWAINAQTAAGADVLIKLAEKSGEITMPDGKSGAQFGLSLVEELGPPRSGGMLAALHLWQRLLLFGPNRFGEVHYLGTLPWGSDDTMADCIVGIHGGVETRFYFDPASADLVGIEMQAADDEDPCEIYFNDIREVDGRRLPHQWTIRRGDETFAELRITSYELKSASAADKK